MAFTKAEQNALAVQRAALKAVRAARKRPPPKLTRWQRFKVMLGHEVK